MLGKCPSDRRRGADLVRRPRPVRQLPRRPAGAVAPRGAGPSPPLWRAFLSNPRRLVEVLADFAIICVSFLTAYLLFADGGGTNTQRRSSSPRCPSCSGSATSSSSSSGSTGGSGVRIRPRPAGDRRRGGSCPCRSRWDRRRHPPFRDFPLEIFVVDALLCRRSCPPRASRCGCCRAEHRSPRPAAARPRRRCRALRSALARELAETPDTRVVGFVDDNPASPPAHPRRQSTAPSTSERLLGELRIDAVLVTIPSAPSERWRSSSPSCKGRRRLPFRRPRDRSAAVPDPGPCPVTQQPSTSPNAVARRRPMAPRRRVPRPRRPLRVAGVQARLADDLLGRDRVHAGLAPGRAARDTLAARRSRAAGLALHVSRGACVVAGSDRSLGSREADRRARDDVGDPSGVRPGAIRDLAAMGSRDSDRGCRCTAARLRAVPARGAAGVSSVDDRAVGGHRRRRTTDAQTPHPRGRRSAWWRRSCGASWACCSAVFGAALGYLLWRTPRGSPAGGATWTRRRLGRGCPARDRGGRRCQRSCGPPQRRMVRRHRLPEAEPRLGQRGVVGRGTDDRARRAAGDRGSRRLPLATAGRPRTRVAPSSFVGVAAAVVFIGYAAVKGAYLARVLLRARELERNVIYLVPIVLAAAAALLIQPLATSCRSRPDCGRGAAFCSSSRTPS